LIVFSVVLICFPAFEVSAQDRTVVVPDDFLSIQEAILSASNGDTVFVRSGSYYGNLIINKSISLIGENKDSTFIVGNETGTTILIQEDYVKVVNFTIKSPQIPLIWNRKRGIHLLQVGFCEISENIILRNDYGIGIWLFKSSNNIVAGNMLEQAAEGIYIVSSINNTFMGNIIQEIGFGIRLHEASNNIFIANNISGNNFEIYFGSDGEYLSHVTNNTFHHNNILNNGVPVGTLGAIVGLNNWDNGKEGNYWTGYQGNDDNDDGIGDTSYLVYENYYNGNHTDNYPLVNPVDVEVIPENNLTLFGFLVLGIILLTIKLAYVKMKKADIYNI